MSNGEMEGRWDLSIARLGKKRNMVPEVRARRRAFVALPSEKRGESLEPAWQRHLESGGRREEIACPPAAVTKMRDNGMIFPYHISIPVQQGDQQTRAPDARSSQSTARSEILESHGRLIKLVTQDTGQSPSTIKQLAFKHRQPPPVVMTTVLLHTYFKNPLFIISIKNKNAPHGKPIARTCRQIWPGYFME